MRTREFLKLKVGDRVVVTGTMDGQTFAGEEGVVVSNPLFLHGSEKTIKFATFNKGWSLNTAKNDHYYFEEEHARDFKITVIPEAPAAPAPTPAAPVKKRPHGRQEYKGNGKHRWESVVEEEDGTVDTERLRVPGGWLYRDSFGGSTFVPVPEAVGYAV